MDLTAWLMALAGGALIGFAATILFVFNRRIAGISGILGNVIHMSRHERGWGAAFLAGLLVAGFAGAVLVPERIGESPAAKNLPMLLLAGVLVGFGTQMGSGCTSGHGVCGLSRLSARSLAATCVFIGLGVGTVTAIRGLGVL